MKKVTFIISAEIIKGNFYYLCWDKKNNFYYLCWNKKRSANSYASLPPNAEHLASLPTLELLHCIESYSGRPRLSESAAPLNKDGNAGQIGDATPGISIRTDGSLQAYVTRDRCINNCASERRAWDWHSTPGGDGKPLCDIGRPGHRTA